MKQRRPLIAGNWKMYCGGASGLGLARGIVQTCGDMAAVDVVVAPPFTALAAVAHEVEGSRVEVAAQNVHPKKEGAFTGEISTGMLVESGCKWVIIGHSERRHVFGETDAFVAEKVEAALAANLKPIVCIGETLTERDAGKTLDVVFRQVDAVSELLAQRPGFSVLAYEPVWAIGTGQAATPREAAEAHGWLRAAVAERDADRAAALRILYGGSVKPDNMGGFLAVDDVDGALVGGASLDPESFARLLLLA